MMVAKALRGGLAMKSRADDMKLTAAGRTGGLAFGSLPMANRDG